MFELRRTRTAIPAFWRPIPAFGARIPYARRDTAFPFWSRCLERGKPGHSLPCPPRASRGRYGCLFPLDLAAGLDTSGGEAGRTAGMLWDLITQRMRRVFEMRDLRRIAYLRSFLQRNRYRMKYHIDFHVHTTGARRALSLEALAAAAKKRGLDAIAVADHDLFTISAPFVLNGVVILPACECSTENGHLVGLLPEREPDCAALHAKGRLPSAAEAAAELSRCGALLAAAHPFGRPL